MLPFIRPRTVYAPAKDVILSHHFFEGDRAASPEALRERQKYQEKMRKLKGGSIFTLPFRQLRFLCWLGFRAVRRVFSAAGFLRLQVDGFNVQWKLDMTAGWALDEGRALDRVVRHRLTS